MSDEEQVEIIETPQQLAEILQQTRTELHRVTEELRISQNNELMLWRAIGQQLFTDNNVHG